MKIIAIANRKGGVGKTTTTINIATALSAVNKTVLVIDFDPQGNTTTSLGVEKKKNQPSSYDILTRNFDISEAIVHTDMPRFDLIPSAPDLAAAEIELVDLENREFILKNALGKMKDVYDYVLIDCPPSLNMLTVNSMTAADTVLVPIQCEYYALEGLSQLIHSVNLIKKKLNPKLELEGVVFTMYDSRNNLSKEVVQNVQANLNENIYKTIIPRNVRLAEAPSYGMPIITYAPDSTGAESYRQLALEMVAHEM